MVAGEKRWASARRGGMTVLGKVAVPKPLNLPSQRLENHGLDPNVDIVPKGTLSWGSRPSSSGSNAWGSSTSSPNGDAGARSPSQLSGRPSSGSGTRPSTAGSDRANEPIPYAWGLCSRPSSASGALTSNQTALTLLRPRSAETRPGSSQLSRFAEPSSDNSVAWGPTGVSEKLGVASSKSDGFSLSSGDFPTLGSEIENSGKITDLPVHGSYGRPGSSSSRAGSRKEKSVTSSDGDISVNVKSGTVNTWRSDDTYRVEDGVQPTEEKWQGDPPPYLNSRFPPQHCDAWHGPPVNHPPGVWYGGPGSRPCGTPLGPGGFQIEPFPFYRPQIPPTALANSQPVPPPGSRPRGNHPNNGDIYRPHIPDAYIRPDMPIRPGFYPGPMAYEGYYGPPIRYSNSDERDIPFMGTAAGPPVYNRYPGENASDSGNKYARVNVHGSTGKASVSEQVESGHSDDTQGPCQVLLKQHNEWDEKQKKDKREHVVPANDPYLEKGNRPRNSSQKHEWGLEDRKDEEIYSGRTFSGDGWCRDVDNRGTCSSEKIKVKLPESGRETKAVDDCSVYNSENVASTFPQVPQVFAATPRDPKLIHKIEGLKANARVSDRRLQVVDAMADSSTNEACTGAVCLERTHTGGNLISSSHEVSCYTEDKALQTAASSATTISRRASHGVEGRFDHRGKRFNTQDADGWRKKLLAAECVGEVSAVNSEHSFSVRDHLTSVEAAEKSGINLQGKDEGELLTPRFDASDCQAQRAKRGEIAKQRTKQLQEVEEERRREQKAKADAKLEELSRRRQIMDGSSQNLEKAPPRGPIQQEQEESGIPAEPAMVASSSETPSSQLVSQSKAQISESSTIGVGECKVLSEDTFLETPDHVHLDSVCSHGQPLPLQQDAHTAGVPDCKAAPQVNEVKVSRHKRTGYKQKQNIPFRKYSTEGSVLIGPTEAPEYQAHVAVKDVASTEVGDGEVGPSSESSPPLSSNVTAESSPHQRRKNNRSSKHKHELDDASSIAALPSTVSKEYSVPKNFTEGRKPKALELELGPSSVQSSIVTKPAIQPSELHPSLPNEEAGGRLNNQWKSQHSRWMRRNQPSNKIEEKLHSSDAVIWAPVRSQDKAEVVDEGRNKTVPDTVTATAKSENVVQNSLKSKRAEIEKYVPKPVANELAQQGSMQQPVPSSVNQPTLDDTLGREEPVQNVGSPQPGNSATADVASAAAKSCNGDGKQTRQSKTHGSWRQRGVVESAVQGMQDGSSSTSDAIKNIQKSVDQYQSLKPDINSSIEQTKSFDGWNTSDGWNSPDNFETAVPVTSAVVRDQEVTGRGKRHPFKGHRSTGNNHDLDHRNANSSCTDKTSHQPLSPELGQTGKNTDLKETRWVGERTTSLWKPKSQEYSVPNKLGNRTVGGQNATAEGSNAIKKHSPSQDRVHLPTEHDKESTEKTVHLPIDQSPSGRKNVVEARNVGHQESMRERKVDSFRGRPHSPNLSSVDTVELVPPASIDTQHEQRFSSGFHKNVNQNNHSGRGNESRGVWSSAGQGNRQHNMSPNRGRQRDNSHYEYQPIGHYGNNKSNNYGGPTDEAQNISSRYRERNQGHSRRGGDNFHGRQRGRTVRVDPSYD